VKQVIPSLYLAISLLSILALQSCATHSILPTQGNTAKQPAEQSSGLSEMKIAGERYFASERADYFRWLDDGSGYTKLEPRQGDKQDDNPNVAGLVDNDIVFYQVDGSGREVLVAYEQLIPEGKSKPIAIDDYSWSADGNWALIYTDSKKVWRSRSRGDYFLLNLNTKELIQLGPNSVLQAFKDKAEQDDAKQGEGLQESAHTENAHEDNSYEDNTHQENPESSRLMFAKFSPDSSKVAYVYKNNIYYQSLGSSQVIALTTDADEHIINGNFDWVYEEELSIADGFRWSPDSESIGYWQLDTSKVKHFTLINNTDTLYPTLTTFPYPKAGETNSAVRVGAVKLSTQQTQWLELEGDNRERYIPRINWANANELLVQDVDRPQQNNQLWLFNINDGSKKAVFSDSDSAFIEYYYDADFINDGQHFIWHSERDGWRKLYRVAKDGSEIINLTPGDFDIIELLAYNEQRNLMYFTASPDNPTQRYLYKASLDGTMTPQRVTPEKFEGNNAYEMSKDGSNAVHYFSNVSTPTQSQTIKVDDHSQVTSLIDNAKLKARLTEVALPEHEFIKLNAQDGTVLDAYIMTPKDIDTRKKYPVIFYVYGEPAASTVQDRWGGQRYLYQAMLVKKGFIVVSVDNRGTRMPKGRDWRKSIYKKIGTITAQDQVDALNEIALRYPFIDTERVGVYGHSGGGSSTLTLLFKHGDSFHAGTAIAPVPDIALYDTIYQERYSGHPKTDPQSYFNTSSINFVEGLTGELLLIHGTGDDNVHYQGTERLINELVRLNKQFEFMSYPNRAHGIRSGENTVVHRLTLMTNFFERHLMAK